MKFSKTKISIIIFLLFIASPLCFAEKFLRDSSYEVCFTPGSDCASKIIQTIEMARKQILVQAYSFTDISIANAIVSAKRKGIDVRIILDKSQLKGKYNLIHFLSKNKIKPIIDWRPAIAHNKVIIIDGLIVIGGSYNYTHSASKRNAENAIIIKDAGLAKEYVNNWHMREQKSVAIDKLCKNLIPLPK
ncbi:MAG: phospholipase D family protein [Gammaproteobacteria bacterium]|nr:phospholipase D family protein [Gammaproteobacteria bacterium]